MGCMHSKNNLPKVSDSDTGLPMQKSKCSKKTLKIQNAAKVKMNKAMAEVKAKGDAKLAAALAGFGGIQLPAATIQHTLDEQTITKQNPLPEQTTPRQISKASMKNDKMSPNGLDDAEAIPVSISTDVTAKMTINDTMNKAEELKEKTESALTVDERPTSSAQSTSSRLISVTEAKSSVDNTLGENLPNTTTVPSKVKELTNDADTMMSVDSDAEKLVKDDKVTEELAQVMPVIERPTSSAPVCSRLIVLAEAKTSFDNTLDGTLPTPSTITSPKTEEKPLNQLVGSSTSSLDKATTNLVDAVFTSLDNEETVQESIAGVQRSDAINDCTMPAALTSTLSLDQEAGFIVDSVLANITKEQLSVEPTMRSTGSTAMDASCQVASLKNLTLISL